MTRAFALRKDAILRGRAARSAGDGLVRVVVEDRGDDPLLGGRERGIEEVAVHPRAQVRIRPRHVLEGHVVVLAPVQHIGAQDQQPVAEALQDDPLDRLGAVELIAILFEGPEGHQVPLGSLAVGQRRVLLDEARRALLRIRVTRQPREDLVGRRRIPGLGQSDSLSVTRAAVMVVAQEGRGQHEENRRECDGSPPDGCLGQARACHRLDIRPGRPGPS